MPAQIRDGRGLGEGTRLVVVDTDDGIVMLTQEQARRRLRAGLGNRSLVDELLEERRRAAAREDADTVSVE